MNKYFRVILSDQVKEFLDQTEENARIKILYNMDKSSYLPDPKLFKKVQDHIWEFRTRYKSIQYRLLAFWDKRGKYQTLVVVTHGIIKKSKRLPKSEIERALKIREEYFKRIS